MESMNTVEMIKRLEGSGLRLLTLKDLQRLFRIGRENTAYKTGEVLVKKGVLLRLRNGLYQYGFSQPDDFEVANALYSPSYVSLESALNFYGVLSQFPYTLTSVTPRRTRKFEVRGKIFDFAHLQRALFFDYRREKNFLIATPEKAFLDFFYLSSKGGRSVDFEGWNLGPLNRKRLREEARKISSPPFRRLWGSMKI